MITSNYHKILISDHSPTSVVLESHCWCFRPSLLSDASFCQFISEKISEFSEINDNSEVTDSTLWESFKAVTRGHIISFKSSARIDGRKRLSEIEQELSQLEFPLGLPPCRIS